MRLFYLIRSFFLPVPKVDRLECWEHTVSGVFKTVFIYHIFNFSPVGFFWILMLSNERSHDGTLLHPLDWGYIWVIWVTYAVSAIVIIMILKYRKNPECKKRLYDFIYCSSLVFFVLQGMATSYESYTTGQYYRIVIMALVFAALTNYPPLRGLTLLMPSYFSYIICNAMIIKYMPLATTLAKTDAVLDLSNYHNENLMILAFLATGLVRFYLGSRQGYQDYLNVRRLVQSQIELQATNEQLNKTNTLLDELAITDPLTGLNNRRALDRYVKDLWPGCKAEGAVVTVAMFDIDFFKSYNDAFGHPAGDAVLRNVARVIKQRFAQAGGMLARYGGEEFIAVNLNIRDSRIIAILEDIRKKIEELDIANPLEKNPQNRITTSIGVAVRDARNLDSIEECIQLADEALYRAKSQGRNRVISDVS